MVVEMQKKSDLKWSTQQRKISDLVPFEGNPRTLNAKQAEELIKSISKFDLVEIPVIDVDNKILAGHMRLNMMCQLGREDEIIDVRVPNRKLTISEAKEYLLRSNKNTGEFDFELLANNFEIELLHDVGFTDEELGIDFDKISAQEDDAPEINEISSIAKLGDIWQVGRHKIICGDCCIIDVIDKLFDGKVANQVLADPPYGVDYASKNEMLNYVDKCKEMKLRYKMIK